MFQFTHAIAPDSIFLPLICLSNCINCFASADFSGSAALKPADMSNMKMNEIICFIRLILKRTYTSHNKGKHTSLLGTDRVSDFVATVIRLRNSAPP